jgi:hypothetical protein
MSCLPIRLTWQLMKMHLFCAGKVMHDFINKHLFKAIKDS